MNTSTAVVRRMIRALVGAAPHVPVIVAPVDGARLMGESYYYTTPSGKTRIRHPTAYARGGNRMRYWPSTLRVEVSPEIVEGFEHAARLLTRTKIRSKGTCINARAC